MATMPHYLRNMNLYVDGRGFAGRVEEVTLPKLTLKTEEYRGGGMDAAVEIDLGMEKLECELTVNEYDPKLFALLGLQPGKQVNISLRGAMDSEGNVIPVAVSLTGSWKEIDMGSWKAGEKASIKVTVSARYYQLKINNESVIEIDVVNMVRMINGEDQLADVRAAIGV
jgi:P2 family phage contractile tail tube protein